MVRALAQETYTLTAELVRELLNYDAETGVFTWRPRDRRHFKTDKAWRTWNSIYPAKQTGTPDKKGYLQIWIMGRCYKAHRLAWLYVHGCFPEADIDHANRVPSDNRLANLREATRAENQRNKGANKKNTSGFNGVVRRGRRFHAFIRAEGQQHFLGAYDSAEHGAAVRQAVSGHFDFSLTHGRDPNAPTVNFVSVDSDDHPKAAKRRTRR